MIRGNLLSAGYPQVKVDEVMGNISTLPESLVGAYYEMLREDVKERIEKDPDYQEKKKQNSS